MEGLDRSKIGAYNLSMKKVIPRTAKTAVSLKKEVFERAESIRKKTGMSRSALYAAALESYFATWEVKEKEAQYAAGYARYPENVAELEAFHQASLASFDKETW